MEVVTRDMNDFSTNRHFDRIVSVEMFEHMRNWNHIERKSYLFWRKFTDLIMHLYGSSVGESFLWPVKNYGVMKTENSGWFPITD